MEKANHQVGVISSIVPRFVPSNLQRWIAIASLAMLFQIALGGVYTVNSVLSNINADLGPSSLYSWLLSAPTLASGTAAIVLGQVGDVFGRRWVSLFTGISAIISCIIALSAHSVGQVVAAQVFLGFNQAGSSLLPASINELVSTKNRGYVFSAVNCLSAVWNIAGSLIAHALLANTALGWKSVYWMILAMNIFGVVATFLFYFPAKPLATKETPARQIVAEFDYVGLFAIIAGPLLVLLGIIWIPQYGARSARFLAPFLAGVAILICLGFYEVSIPKKPMLHPFLWKRVRTFTMILIVTFSTGMVYYSIFALFPVFLASVYDGSDIVGIGVDSIPLGTGNVLGGLTVGFLLPWLGPKIGTTPLLVAGPLLQIIFLPMLALSKFNSKSIPWAFSFLGAAGLGVIELLTIILIQYSAPDEWIGFASGSLALLRSLGGSSGNAIFQTVLQNKIAQFVPTAIATAALENGLPKTSLQEFIEIMMGVVTTTPITSVPGVSDKIILASTVASRKAYIQSFNWIWYVAIVFMFVGLVCAALTKDLSPVMVKHRAQHLKFEDSGSQKAAEMKAEEGASTTKDDLDGTVIQEEFK
ncbi:uncharacterized protein Z518_11328 [Rhinocladiella mackenziei CBS 650.93]|uniref:Major facilitator superfamily (MFS) profile domain-containing protein n=1 Tax=Rhinocladiella mackenziei CBS 650.93 TaxID=1442369 RepID=A0A0D2IS83_9EURO|nr:uncharacterized protein Z518_11328 [Rhinocladiella mackenziei CBS 650.93]KIW99589.1 hypothetical protein Z518_11328 [Rhinocladiella mackenziei CBS 650.93]